MGAVQRYVALIEERWYEDPGICDDLSLPARSNGKERKRVLSAGATLLFPPRQEFGCGTPVDPESRRNITDTTSFAARSTVLRRAR